jgi:putative oligomerization/nucleic acid binding protein
MPLTRRCSMRGRRRPLARAAVVGGAAAYAGSKRAESQAREADEQARIEELEAQQDQAPVAAAQPAEDPMEQLRELAELHDQGILTDAEFEVQKQKILQGM